MSIEHSQSTQNYFPLKSFNRSKDLHLNLLTMMTHDPCHSSKVLLSSLVHASSAVSSSLPNRAIADIETKPVPSGDSFNQLLSICFYVLDLESQTSCTLSSFSALPFRVACAFCESVLDPAAYPRWEQRLYTFVCICVSVCEVLKAQSCSIMNYVPLPPKNSLYARSKQTEPRGWHEMTSQIVHSSTSTTSTYPFRILVQVRFCLPHLCFYCLHLLVTFCLCLVILIPLIFLQKLSQQWDKRVFRIAVFHVRTRLALYLTFYATQLNQTYWVIIHDAKT